MGGSIKKKNDSITVVGKQIPVKGTAVLDNTDFIFEC